MSQFEVDPIVSKAMRLLHSTADDSVQQLKTMLEEAMGHMSGQPEHLNLDIESLEEPVKAEILGSSIQDWARNPSQNQESLLQNRAPRWVQDSTICDSNNQETVTIQAIHDSLYQSQDSSQELDFHPELFEGKQAIQNIMLALHSPSQDVYANQESAVQIQKKGQEFYPILPPNHNPRDSPLSELNSARSTPDLCENALEIFEDELTCSVCQKMAVSARNVLVECSDCHLLYHQECHKPPVRESEANDPRSVWYCSQCFKKSQEKVQIKIKNHSPSSEKEIKVKIKHEGSKEKSSSGLFKRHEKSSSSDSQKSSGGGMAHLAASFQSSKTPSPSTSKSSLSFVKAPGSPSSKNQTTTASTNIIAADKRLQNMKKKAAAKMQEKRKK